MNKSFIVLLFCCLLTMPAFAKDDDAVTPTGLEISVGAWIKPTFSGIVKGGVNTGTEISLTNNLGLSSQTILVPRAMYRWAHGQIFDLRYSQYSQTATVNLNAPETFQGINFAQGASVSTRMKVQWGDISYELPIAYDVFPPRDSYLNAVVNIKAIRGTFTITDSAGRIGVHPPIIVPYPMFGLHGKARLYPETEVEFRALGIRAGFVDAIGWSYDFEAGITQKIYEGFSITGKYRYFTFYNRDATDNRFGFRLYGPEVNASYHF